MEDTQSPEPRPSVRTDIVMLTSGGQFGAIIANDVAARFGPFTIIEEEPEPPSVLNRRRRRMLGSLTVAGQQAFGAFNRILWKLSSRRRNEIIATERLDVSRPAACRIHRVASVNAPECRKLLRSLAPKVVLVVGTRMIRTATLDAVEAPFVNYHAGINPKYRGIHGGYWALATGDQAGFGVTLHLIDQGVDTGGILYTGPAKSTRRDNITTYGFLQAAAARPLVAAAIEDALEGALEVCRGGHASRQWFHPTLWRYAWNGVSRGVW